MSGISLDREINVPKKIRELLSDDEIVQRKYDLKDIFSFGSNSFVYATNYRLIIDGRISIRAIMYKHISSLSLQNKSHIFLIILGFATIAFAFIGMSGQLPEIRNIVPVQFEWIVILVGLLLMIKGFIPKRILEITVAGLPEPCIIEGTEEKLEELFKLVISSNPDNESLWFQ